MQIRMVDEEGLGRGRRKYFFLSSEPTYLAARGFTACLIHHALQKLGEERRWRSLTEIPVKFSSVYAVLHAANTFSFVGNNMALSFQNPTL